MRNEIATCTVPGTPVTIVIEHQPADERLAALLGDRAGRGMWVERWFITRNPNGADFVNYLTSGAGSLDEARTEANFLWSDTVTRRDASQS
jgi:hypothetical protein